MANNNVQQTNIHSDFIVEQDILGLNLQNAIPLEDLPQNFNGNNGTNRFGAVRDRLFHVMLVKMALSYNQKCSYMWRRIFEMFTFLTVKFFENFLKI